MLAPHRPGKLGLLLLAAVLAVVFNAAVVVRGGWRTAGAPRAVDGILNLSGWDLERSGRVPLNGQWEFYWRQLLTPEDFRYAGGPKHGDLIAVPSVWNGTATKTRAKLAGLGYGTYRLRITGLVRGRELGLHLFDLGTAYRLWVDGKLEATNGRVGVSKSESVPLYRPQTIYFRPHGRSVEVVLQVSNFHNSRGGFWSEAILGPGMQMRGQRFRELGLDVFLMSYLMTMAVYHFGLALLRRHEPAPVLLGLLSLLAALRTGLTGEMPLAQAFPVLPWSAHVALQYLTAFLSAPLFAAFVRRLYPQEVAGRFVTAEWLLALPFALSAPVLPATVFTRLAVLWEIALVPGLLYLVFAVGKALGRNRDGAFIFLIGTATLVFAAINDVLVANNVLYTPYLMDVGFLVFTVCESAVLSIQFATATDRIVALNQALAEDRYRSIFEHTGTAMVMVEADSTIAAVNYEFTRLFGYAKEQVEGQPWTEFVVEQDVPLMQAYHAARLVHPEEPPATYECHMRDNQGQTRTLSITVSIIPGTSRSVASLIDVTERKQVEELIGRERRRLQSLVQNLPCGVVMIAQDGAVLYSNPMASEILGYTSEDIPTVQTSFEKFYPNAEYRQQVLARWEQDTVAAQQVNDRIHEVTCKDGRTKHLSFGLTFLDDGNSIVTFVDATQRVKDQELVRHLAEHDYLTGLPNVKLLEERLNQDFARTQRSGGMLAVMFLDLDKFKDVNDTYGHQVGDRLLHEVALRLQTVVRESDTVGRIGGDEFCILLPDIASRADATAVAERIIRAFGQPCAVDGHQVRICPSIGISTYPDDGHTPEELMKMADTAMYRAKKEGLTGYWFSAEETTG